MKYFMVNNKEWDWDELDKDETLFFSAPYNFEFTPELSKQYQESIGKKTRVNEQYPYIEVEGDYWYDGDIRRIMGQDNEERKKLIEWLKQFGFVKLEYEEW